MHDVFNRFLLDIGMYHYRSSEIEEAKAHIEALKEITGERPVLIMFARNYESLEFMDFLEQKGIKYLIRLHKGNYETEKAQMSSADEEEELIFTKARMGHLRAKSPERMRELVKQKSKRQTWNETLFQYGRLKAPLVNGGILINTNATKNLHFEA